MCLYEALKYDVACINVESSDTNGWLYSLSSDCASCPYARTTSIRAGQNVSVNVNVGRPLTLRVLDNDGEAEYVSALNLSDTICELSPAMGQFGIYRLSIGNRSCRFETLKEPTDSYAALFLIFGALTCALLAASGARALYKSCARSKCLPTKPDASAASRGSIKRRMYSIDTFRGISISAMIFVNNGAGGYNTLGHATWDGLLFGDLVFPCFAWIMGVCIALAVHSRAAAHGTSKWEASRSIVKRGALLFLIGLSLNTVAGSVQLETIRIFGVLQRLAISYSVVGLACVLRKPGNPVKLENGPLRVVRDVIVLLPHWGTVLALLATYCAITFALPVPSCPTGYLGPGGLHDGGKYDKCAGGAAGYIDKLILGESHVFQYPAINAVYKSGPFEPEGILGCLTSIFQVFLGVQAGQIVITYKQWKSRVVRWLAWAVLLGGAGCALHLVNAIPVNKSLWSLSYVLVTSSLGFSLLCGCYLLVDVAAAWGGGPFRIPGMNALAMYVGHQVCYKMFPFRWRFGQMNTHAWCTLEAVWSVVCWTCVAYIMHRKRQYITL